MSVTIWLFFHCPRQIKSCTSEIPSHLQATLAQMLIQKLLNPDEEYRWLYWTDLFSNPLTLDQNHFEMYDLCEYSDLSSRIITWLFCPQSFGSIIESKQSKRKALQPHIEARSAPAEIKPGWQRNYFIIIVWSGATGVGTKSVLRC